MKMLLDDSKLIYLQIASSIEDEILRGSIGEEEQVYSTNQLAKIYGINPATAAKGVNLLTDEGVLYKKRGIGMFVALGARDIIVRKRKEQFINEFVRTLFVEAEKLGITKTELMDIIERYERGGEEWPSL
ncbi:MAG: GntR family transcriptional regulator [Clostridiales bacterium]|nr:GntR family transcriptional regulator [Clostridiales bacterium]